MASSEATARDELPASKKRVAMRQITKDEEPDSDEDGGGAIAGTFQRASDEVLAERRIVKVRRTPAPPSGPNPFASIRLVPPTVSAQESNRSPANPLNSRPDTVDPVPSNGTVEQSADFAGKVESENMPSAISEEQETTNLPQEAQNSATITLEVNAEDVVDDGAVKSSSVTGDVKDETINADADTLNGSEEAKARDPDIVGSSETSSSTFEQLSSARNAFAISFGTGFSSSSSTASSSSLSSTSSGFTFGQPFTFGTQPFGTGLTFGAGHTQALGSSKGSDGAFPEVASVFGKSSNGIGIPPLFNTTAPLAAAPKPAVVSLPEIHVETGEEKEKAIFTADASLFEFIEGGWKERGKGELKLNVSEENQKRSRLVMRSKGNYRLLLNASLYPDMKVSKMDNRGISFVCANSAAEGKTGLSTYAVKLKDAIIASEFTTTVDAHKGSASNEPKTPESSPKGSERPAKVEASNIEA